MLGEMLLKGEGVKCHLARMDFYLVFLCFSHSESFVFNESEDAIVKKIRDLKSSVSFGLQGNETLAAQYFMLAAKQGSAEALRDTVRCLFVEDYWKKWTTPKTSNPVKNQASFDSFVLERGKSCESEAKEIVGQLFRTGTGLPQDEARLGRLSMMWKWNKRVSVFLVRKIWRKPPVCKSFCKSSKVLKDSKSDVLGFSPGLGTNVALEGCHGRQWRGWKQLFLRSRWAIQLFQTLKTVCPVPKKELLRGKLKRELRKELPTIRKMQRSTGYKERHWTTSKQEISALHG